MKKIWRIIFRLSLGLAALIVGKLMLFLDVPDADKLIVEFCAQMRKYGCVVWMVVQQLQKLVDAAIAPYVFGNCRQYVILKQLDAGEPRLSGKVWKITASMQAGISQENAKKIAKLIRDEGPKGVKCQIQGEELRISSKSRDDLQAVQALIKEQDYDFAVQYVNYR